MHQRLTNGHTNIQRVILALKYKKKKVYRKQRCPSKPDQQVGESASICTHVSSDELPDAAQIHAAPGVLSSLSPLIVKNGHIRR